MEVHLLGKRKAAGSTPAGGSSSTSSIAGDAPGLYPGQQCSTHWRCSNNFMAGLAERLRRVSVAHDTGVQFSYPAPTVRGRGANGNTSVLHSEVEGSIPSVSTRYLLLA